MQDLRVEEKQLDYTLSLLPTILSSDQKQSFRGEPHFMLRLRPRMGRRFGAHCLQQGPVKTPDCSLALHGDSLVVASGFCVPLQLSRAAEVIDLCDGLFVYLFT